MIRSILLGTLCSIPLVTASPVLIKRDFPNPEPCRGNCSWIHDPNIWLEGDTYYRFSTSGNIAIATASSLNGPWEYKGAVLDHGTKIIVDQSRQDIWAPNVVKIGATYYCYYSVSFIGSQNSQIGVATSTTLKVGSWTDHGSMNLPKSPDYNLIDPSIFQDDDAISSLYFTFGSYWHGIYQTTLSKNSLTTYAGDANSMRNMIRNSTAGADVVEGAYMFKHDKKYYMFFSAGNCCAIPPHLATPGHEYRILVCRADQVGGPYVDREGRNCLTQSGGTVVLGSHGDIYAPGGQGVMLDPKSNRVVLYYHYVRPSVGYDAKQFLFGFNYLNFQNGWPVIAS